MGRLPLRLGRPKGRPQAPFQPSHENRYHSPNWSSFTPPKWSNFSPPLTASNEINGFAQNAEWILDSGSKSQSYLYQTTSGELFQLPIAYYTGDSYVVYGARVRPQE